MNRSDDLNFVMEIMKKKLKTSIEFAKNLFTTGAISESNAAVEQEVCRHVPRDRDCVVVEYGMGHGNITREILSRINEHSKVYSFEVNEKFCRHVRKEIQDERLHIINDSAEFIKKHVPEPVDLVIGSIPFSFFSKEKGLAIIGDSYDKLKEDCFYSQALYTKFNIKKFRKIFDHCSMTKIPSLPTWYVYHCIKKTEV